MKGPRIASNKLTARFTTRTITLIFIPPWKGTNHLVKAGAPHRTLTKRKPPNNNTPSEAAIPLGTIRAGKAAQAESCRKHCFPCITKEMPPHRHAPQKNDQLFVQFHGWKGVAEGTKVFESKTGICSCFFC